MNTPDCMQILEEFARFSPQGKVTLEQAIAQISRAIGYCRQAKHERLLIDITALSGFKSPPIGARYWFVQEWAREADGQVTIAMVARPDYIDPEKFGVLIAANAGLKGNVFASEPEALDWLLEQS